METSVSASASVQIVSLSHCHHRIPRTVLICCDASGDLHVIDLYTFLYKKPLYNLYPSHKKLLKRYETF